MPAAPPRPRLRGSTPRFADRFPHRTTLGGASVRAGILLARLIYVNDPANGSMALTADLGDRLSTAGAFLISGFNAMRDPRSAIRDADLLDRRLATVATDPATRKPSDRPQPD